MTTNTQDTEPPAPVAQPVGMDEFEGLVARYDSALRYTGAKRVARAALLDAYRRGGAVGGDEAEFHLNALHRYTSDLQQAVRDALDDLRPFDTPALNRLERLLSPDAHVLSRPGGSGDEPFGADGRYAELSAVDEADARRCADILAAKYDIVRIAQDHGTGDWSVVYTHPRALAVQPEPVSQSERKPDYGQHGFTPAVPRVAAPEPEKP